MPMYTFRDELSQYEVDVIRTVDERNDAPTDEELPEEERGKERKWQKLSGKGIRMTRGPGWRGGKGYW